MPYQYLEDIATADIAFSAWEANLEALFTAAADATMNVMIEQLDSIQPLETHGFRLRSESIDMLLFDFLQELIFLKDSRRLLLRAGRLSIQEINSGWELEAKVRGEVLDPARHEQRVDVKAVTLHRFQVEETEDGWQAQVILDI